MCVSIQIQYSFKQNRISGKHNAGQKKPVPGSSKQNHQTQPSNGIKNNFKKKIKKQTLHPQVCNLQTALQNPHRLWGWKHEALRYPIHKSLWPLCLGGMFYRQLLPLRLMLPLPKYLSLVLKPPKARIRPYQHLDLLLWSIQTVTALRNKTRQPGTRHTEPEGVAGEQSKEDVAEETMPGIWLSWRCSLELFLFDRVLPSLLVDVHNTPVRLNMSTYK